MDNKRIFAANLKKYMEMHNKSRQEICKALGINYYTFTDWVNGKKYPRIEKVKMLAKYFGISMSDLIEEKSMQDFSASKKALIDFAQTVPEDKAAMILQAMKSIVEAD